MGSLQTSAPQMLPPQPPAPQQTSVLAGLAKVITALVGAAALVVGGAWTATRSQDVRDAVCPQVNDLPLHHLFCGTRYDPVSSEEATDFLVRYYGAATASGNATAWDLMDPEMRSSIYQNDKGSFAAGVSTILWTEVIEKSTPGDGLNEYVVHLRSYYLDGNIEPYRVTVRLRKDAEKNVFLLSAGDRTRVEGGIRLSAYPWAYLDAPTDLYRYPRHNSDITMPAKDQQSGGRLRALCELEVPTAPGSLAAASDAGWWTRTNQGWISNERLTAQGARLSIQECSTVILGY